MASSNYQVPTVEDDSEVVQRDGGGPKPSKPAGFQMPETGSAAFYDLIAPVYATSADQVARTEFFKQLISDNKAWIGLDKLKGKAKVLDYGCGTGILSLALAPYVSEILGIDKSQKMVSEYNKIAQKSASTNPSCRMKAFRGDISAFPEDQPGLTDEVESNDEIQSFDLIAISLTMDFFSMTSGYNDPQNPVLLQTLINLAERLKPGGSFLIIDIEKHYHGHSSQKGPADREHGGRKPHGFGSKETMAALEQLGMEAITISEGHLFHFTAAGDGQGFCLAPGGRQELYFMMKATRGIKYHELAAAACPCCGFKK